MSYASDTPVSVLKWPQELAPNAQTLHLQSNTTRFVSPFTRGMQTQEMPGGRFRLSFGLPPMRDTATRMARAFLAKLRGGAGRFYFRAEVTAAEIPDTGAAELVSFAALTVDSTALTADGTRCTADATLIPVQFPAAATGATTAAGELIVSTAAPTGAVLVQAGRHISYDGPSGWRRLHLVVDDAVVRRDGTVRIAVEPPIKELPAAAAPLHLTNPSGVFALVDDDQGALALQLGRIAQGIVIDAIEATPPI